MINAGALVSLMKMEAVEIERIPKERRKKREAMFLTYIK
jgi:hypothetical protein